MKKNRRVNIFIHIVLLLTACNGTQPATEDTNLLIQLTPEPPLSSTTVSIETLLPTITVTPTAIPKPNYTPTFAPPNSINFDIQEGVSENDINDIREGAAIAHEYLELILGGDEVATWPDFTIRIHHSDEEGECCLGLTNDGPGPRIFTLNPDWENVGWGGYLDIRVYHMRIIAHEYAHSWQSANGCLGRGKGEPLGFWFTEGMAEYIAWNALIYSGYLKQNQPFEFNALGLSDPNKPEFGKIRSWEHPDSDFRNAEFSYNYAFFAVSKIVIDYGSPIILREICEQAAVVNKTTELRDYLNFPIILGDLGIDLQTFYEEFILFMEIDIQNISTAGINIENNGPCTGLCGRVSSESGEPLDRLSIVACPEPHDDDKCRSGIFYADGFFMIPLPPNGQYRISLYQRDELIGYYKNGSLTIFPVDSSLFDIEGNPIQDINIIIP